MISFYNAILEKLNYLLEENSQQYLKFTYKAPKEKNIKVSIISDFTKEEIDQIRNTKSTNVASTSLSHFIRPKKETDIVEKDLYKITYLKGSINSDTKKFEEKQLFAFCYFKKGDFEKTKELLKKINSINPPKEYIKIEPIEFKDLIRLIKHEELGPKYKKKLITLLGDDLDKVTNESITYATKQKEYEKNKGAKEPYKEKEDTENIKAVKKSEELYGVLNPEVKDAANKFFYSSKNSRILQNIIDAHKRSKLETISGVEKKKAIDIRNSKINTLINNINSITIKNLNDLSAPDEKSNLKINIKKVRNAIVTYVIYVKIKSEYPEDDILFDKIHTVYKKADGKQIVKIEPPSDVEEKPKKKEKKPKKEEPAKDIDKDASEYILTYYNTKSGDEETGVVPLTDIQAENAKRIARENKPGYEKLKKAFIDWDMSTDPNKYSKENMPNIDILKGAQTLLIGITKKPLVSEMSSTGGGAAPGTGAGVTPGEGEGVATKYAFGGAGGTKAKRKKGIVDTKKIKNIKSENYFFLKNDAKMIFLETVRGYLNNK